MKCNCCGKEKPAESYYDSSPRVCKECIKDKVRKRRADKIDEIREYDRNRPNRKERAETCARKYKESREKQDPIWLEKDRERIREYRKKNPEKYRAHSAVSNGIRDGNISKPESCSCCGKETSVQGHHWSYLEEHWLDVVWLCTSCHAKEHIRLREEGRDPDK